MISYLFLCILCFLVTVSCFQTVKISLISKIILKSTKPDTPKLWNRTVNPVASQYSDDTTKKWKSGEVFIRGPARKRDGAPWYVSLNYF